MGFFARAAAGLRFGGDIARSTLAAARVGLRGPRPVLDAGADEVHFLIEGDPATDLSPAARYRACQYVPLLEAAGWRCHLRPSRPGKYWTAGAAWQRRYARWPQLAMLEAHFGWWQQRRRRRRDFAALAGRGVVFLQRDLQALSHSRLEHELPLWNRHVVFDFDDAIWEPPPWSATEADAAVVAQLRAKIAGLCALATTVIAANEHLAAFARAHCARVHVLPTVLCTDTFRPDPARPPNARPVIGWAGTSGNLWYLRRLAPALRELARRHDFVLRVVCNRVPPAALPELPPDRLEFVEWRAADEVARLQHFDVGIMPLDDDAWARGKAGFKMIQYMACGVPFVASPVGANPDVGGADGDAGLYARDTADWVAALATLLADPARRRTLGAAGRARAVAQFERRVHLPALIAILREAAHA